MRFTSVHGVLACALMAGCASTGVYVPVQLPAEIHIEGFSSVAVAGMNGGEASVDRTDGGSARELAGRLQDRLASEKGIKGTGFHVIPSPEDEARSTADMIALARRDGHAGLVIADFLPPRYHEAVERAEIDDPDRGKTPLLVRRGLLRGEAVLSVYETGEPLCVWSDTLRSEQRAEKRASGGEPAPIDQADLLTRAIVAIIDEFTSRCVPRTEREVAIFLLDDRHPDIAKGIRAAGGNRWNDAVAIFERIAAAGKGAEGEDRLLYNLGVSHMYAQNFRSAEEAFRRAASIRDEQRYADALERNRRMEDQYLEWNRQGREQR